jgi:hypothetical protein
VLSAGLLELFLLFPLLFFGHRLLDLLVELGDLRGLADVLESGEAYQIDEVAEEARLRDGDQDAHEQRGHEHRD